ncbi:MAG: 4-demethylwyosine synthase TYW1 [Methanobacteriales archaeon HGW-Methanobacteriales-1]|jgi:tRNA wybutosine-synthesizing protein 1|nr:MAG: 4-demethylwyosine synthase TYW1 [Methanobacteriales archaeon HGW-Methanobacteriales-1]
MILTIEQRQKLEKMGYRFAGENYHAAAKICHWTKKSILDEGVCYKEKFYGIESHRCLQMSPSIPFCQQKCFFCWRDLSSTDIKWEGPYDEPKEIIEDCIQAQKKLLCGFFGNEKANKKKAMESGDPKNAAISLAGEPMLYPEIGELISEFNRRDFTTFLVSNGLTPSKLKELPQDPTQLYISLDAPEKDTYQKLCRPQIEGAWENLNDSLELLSTFDCRKVLRITAVREKNMFDPQGYADLIKKAQPDFVEVKAYMFVGYSRQRMALDNMPMFSEVKDFARDIGNLCGMEVVNESTESRVVLLA